MAAANSSHLSGSSGWNQKVYNIYVIYTLFWNTHFGSTRSSDSQSMHADYVGLPITIHGWVIAYMVMYPRDSMGQALSQMIGVSRYQLNTPVMPVHGWMLISYIYIYIH